MTTARADTIVRGGRIVTATATFEAEGSVAIEGEHIVLVGLDELGTLEQEPGSGRYLHRGAPTPPIGGSVR